MADEEEGAWTLEELVAIHNRAPDFFLALELEDPSIIGSGKGKPMVLDKSKGMSTITPEQVDKIQKKQQAIFDALEKAK